jgi:hypothetical protein
MATVYKALHMGFDEVCALKVIIRNWRAICRS